MDWRLHLVLASLLVLASCSTDNASVSEGLNYDNTIIFDAESLAEGGVAEAYAEVLPELKKFVASPASIAEELDEATGAYVVTSGSKRFAISGPDLADDNFESWGRATYALFTIVNDQLASSDHRFYAFYGGNDLAGMFLKPADAEAASKSIEEPGDRPYLPDEKPPWFGLPH